MQPDYAFKLINAGFEKLKAYAPVFELDTGRSEFCANVARRLEQQSSEEEAELQSA